MTNLIIHYFDLFGTAVFAVTGALCGVRHKLDLLGVVVFGCTVGVGGGILRDAIIGAVPVAALKDKSYLLICIISAQNIQIISVKHICLRDGKQKDFVCRSKLGIGKITYYFLFPIPLCRKQTLED